MTRNCLAHEKEARHNCTAYLLSQADFEVLVAEVASGISDALRSRKGGLMGFLTYEHCWAANIEDQRLCSCSREKEGELMYEDLLMIMTRASARRRHLLCLNFRSHSRLPTPVAWRIHSVCITETSHVTRQTKHVGWIKALLASNLDDRPGQDLGLTGSMNTTTSLNVVAVSPLRYRVYGGGP